MRDSDGLTGSLFVRPTTPQDEWQANNFDLIRLFAALQVAIVHCIALLHGSGFLLGMANSALRKFPGVPIFFLISGCLVSKSYERSGSLYEYYRNRCLRIFPGLWVCLAASLLVIGICGVATLPAVSSTRWLAWWAVEMSGHWPTYAGFLPIGTRTLNPSLWTIPLELQFYLMLPVLYALLPRRRARSNFFLLALMLISWLAQLRFEQKELAPESRWYDPALTSILPALWVFLVGVLIQRNWPTLRPWLAGRAHWWILAYLVLVLAAARLSIPLRGEDMQPAILLVLAGVVFSCAMSARGLGDRLLRGQDVSYGIYIYHMLVLDVLVQYQAVASAASASAFIATTLALAALSWTLIERPFLSRKGYGVRRQSTVPARRVPASRDHLAPEQPAPGAQHSTSTADLPVAAVQLSTTGGQRSLSASHVPAAPQRSGLHGDLPRS